MRDFNDAAKARLGSVWNANQSYLPGEVGDSPATPYGIVSVSTGMGTAYRLTADHGALSMRIVVQSIGRDAEEVGFAVEKADAAFLDQRLSVSGYDCTPALAEASSQIIRDPDGGVLLSVTQTYTFTAYPA